MSSIHAQQNENTYRELSGTEAVEKIKELADKAKTCFFCTSGHQHFPLHTRPMAVQQVDNQGNLWFLSAVDSHKNEEIATDQDVQLLFQGSAHSDFLSIYGKATVSKDKEKIDELWEPVIKTWFTEGKDDPRITVIKVTPVAGYYWDNKHGDAVAFLKMAVGAALGKTMDDSVEGSLKV